MRTTTSILLLWLASLVGATAAPLADAADSLRTTDIEEVVVVSTPKEHTRLRQQPLASTSLAHDEMLERGISGLKDLSALAPGLFIPDYGSRLTTSMYVRGVGSRTGTPAVALYVDGVPQVSGPSYDFNFAGVDRVDVLRGPQGTLYGRGSMGGVVRVYTKNPFHYQGTEVDLDAAHAASSLSSSEGGRGRGRISLTHYHRISERFAFSANLFGNLDGGFFRNAARDNELIDDQRDLGARMRFGLKPNSTVDLDLTIGHEWLKQGGYPYEFEETGQIAYDNRSGYRRNLTNVGLTAEKRWPRTTLTSVTGFQNLHDRMDLDQDFTPVNLYTLMQRQNRNTLSEELLLQSRHAESQSFRYDWLVGASVFQQWARTEGPVTFHDDGLQWLNGLVNQQGNAHLPTVTSRDDQGQEEFTMNFTFDNLIRGSELAFPGTYNTPETNAALFHQSTFQHLFGVKDLSLIAGLRADVEHFSLEHDAHYAFTQSYGLGGRLTYPDGSVREGMVLVPARDYDVADALQGHLSKSYVQLLPRLSIQWRKWYASVARGHRSGGYNIQLFSDLLQTRMQTAIMRNVANATVPVVEAVPMIPADVKQTVRDLLVDMGTSKPMDVDAATWYRPETSWNYEVGTHQTLWDGRIQADAALYWMQTRDQQVSQMSAGGLGRVTVNSGRSRSLGGELAVKARLTDGLTAQAAYGYTHARFRTGDKTFVPFVPRHTLSAGITQEWTPSQRYQQWVDVVSLHADYRAAGRIYWTEDNAVSQRFAGLLNARLTLTHKGKRELPASPIPGQQQLTHQTSVSLSAYAVNLLSTRYQTFCFETMSRRFAQYTRPMELGVSAQLRF